MDPIHFTASQSVDVRTSKDAVDRFYEDHAFDPSRVIRKAISKVWFSLARRRSKAKRAPAFAITHPAE